MSSTALDHPLVRNYLFQLSAAMRGLPPAQARELKEQITAHLSDALPADADDQQVAAALRRLGPPSDFAAEAEAAIPPSRSSIFGALLATIRPRTWIIAAVIVIVAVVAARWADYYLSVPSLTYSNGGDWWYSQDAKHENIVATWTATQNTTPIRSGQRQGYIVSLFNGTKVTQTIVGDASGEFGWNSPGSGTEQLTVSGPAGTYQDIGNGFVGQTVASGLVFLRLPVSIPPFQTRIVKVLWTSDFCLTAGQSNGIDVLRLRVRVGWFTRTESIPQQGWYLIGPSHGRCIG